MSIENPQNYPKGKNNINISIILILKDSKMLQSVNK